MTTHRSHRVTTSDGVTIGGTVHGRGRPLVFVHGIMGDGDIDWTPLVGHLQDRFTCHLPSMRCRGLSGDHPDLGLGRQIEDFATYVDSIGGPVGLVGWSGGANLSLGVAARSDAVDAVVAYEPVANSVMDEHQQQALGEAVGRAAELAGSGDLSGAARAFAGWPFADGDIAAATEAGYFEATARYVPNLLAFFQQFREFDGMLPDDPAVLGAVSAPTLVLHGADSTAFMAESARHVVDHVPDARLDEMPGAGHAAPISHPEALADSLTGFFAGDREPA